MLTFSIWASSRPKPASSVDEREIETRSSERTARPSLLGAAATPPGAIPQPPSVAAKPSGLTASGDSATGTERPPVPVASIPDDELDIPGFLRRPFQEEARQ